MDIGLIIDFEFYVLSIANYAAVVWDFKDHPVPRILQNRIHRLYLKVNRFASVAATNMEMDHATPNNHS